MAQDCTYIPGDDLVLVRRVRACLLDLPARDQGRAEPLQLALSRWYPRVVVVEPLRRGSLRYPPPLSVYRDGHPPAADPDRGG